MKIEKIISDLELCSRVIQSSTASKDEKLQCENKIMEFRSNLSLSSYKYLLSALRDEFILFEVLTSMKMKIVVEWDASFTPEQIESIHTFLLGYLTKNATALPYSLLERVIQNLCLILKKCYLDPAFAHLKTNYFSKVGMLIGQEGNPVMCSLGLHMLGTLVTEFDMISRDPSVYISFIGVQKTIKKIFEVTDLPSIHTTCMQVLRHLGNKPQLNETSLQLFVRGLQLLNTVLGWSFSGQEFNVHASNANNIENNELPTLSPAMLLDDEEAGGPNNANLVMPMEWRGCIVQENLPMFCFSVLEKYIASDRVVHSLLMILEQLASLKGPIFASVESHMVYYTHFLQGIMQSAGMLKKEFLAYLIPISRNLFDSLTRFSPHDKQQQLGERANTSSAQERLYSELPSPLFLRAQSMVEGGIKILVDMAMLFLRESESQTAGAGSAHEAIQNFDAMLDIFVILLNNPHVNQKLFAEHTHKIFLTYLESKTKIAALVGRRVSRFGRSNKNNGGGIGLRQKPGDLLSQPIGSSSTNSRFITSASSSNGTFNASDDEEDYLEEDDTIAYEDQLSMVALFARQSLEKTLFTLAQSLHCEYRHLLECKSEADLDKVTEALCWVLIIIGNVLCDSENGEIPRIPAPLLQYYAKYYEGNLFNNNPESNPVMNMIENVLQLNDVEQKFQQKHNGLQLSPSIQKNYSWFLNRWIRAYFLQRQTISRYESKELEGWSGVLVKHYSTINEKNYRLLSHILERVYQIYLNSPMEAALLTETAKNLDALSTVHNIAAIFHTNFRHLFDKYLQLFASKIPLAPASVVELMGRFVRLCTSGDKDISHILLEKILFMIDNEFQMINNQMASLAARQRQTSATHSLNTQSQSPAALARLLNPADLVMLKHAILHFLDLVSGLCVGTTFESYAILFTFLQKYLDIFPVLLKTYSDDQDIVVTILEIYNSISTNVLPYLDDQEHLYLMTQIKKLLEVECALLKDTQAKSKPAYDNEETNLNEMTLLMGLLENLLELNFSTQVTNNFQLYQVGKVSARQEVAFEAVVHFLSLVTTVLDASSLSFPKITTCFYNLFFHLSCYSPLILLSFEFYGQAEFFKCINVSLFKYGSDMTIKALQAVASLAQFMHQLMTSTNNQHEVFQAPNALASVESLVVVVTKSLLFGHFNVDLLSHYANALFSLGFCFKDLLSRVILSIARNQFEYDMIANKLGLLMRIFDTPTCKLDLASFNLFMQDFNSFVVVRVLISKTISI